MDIQIHSIDTLKDGVISTKSKGRTFRVEGAQPQFIRVNDWIKITGQSFEEYYNQEHLLSRTAPDREITRTGKIFLNKKEILSLLECAVENDLISKKELLRCLIKRKKT